MRVTALTIAFAAISSAALAQDRPAPTPKPDPGAIYELAYKYDSGDGVPRDSAKALAMYRQAADLGSTNAMLRLGYLYENGKAVPLDHSQAAEWYRRASEQGQSKAMFMLGVCYWAGRGVPADQLEAYKWLDLAATYSINREQDTAVNARVALERVLTPEQIQEAKKRAREWQIAYEKRPRESFPGKT